MQVNVTHTNDLQYTYFLKDHLGSPLRSVEASQVEDSSARFDPWGRAVQQNGIAADLRPAEEAEAFRGYTGHELIASVGMNHMNGRVYAPQIGL